MLQTYKTHLLSKNQLTHNVYLFRFGLDEPKELNFIPGQYIIVFVPQPEGEPARRLFSIASSSTERSTFELLVEIIPNGLASEYLLKLEPEDAITFQGPAGIFILKDDQKNKVFLVTGTGIAPIRSMILSSLNANRPTPNYKLLWGVPTLKDVYLLDEFKKLAQEYPNFSFTICLSRETDLNMVPEEDRQYFKLGHINDNAQLDLTNTDYYLCGSPKVIESLKEYLLLNNVSAESIILEKF